MVPVYFLKDQTIFGTAIYGASEYNFAVLHLNFDEFLGHRSNLNIFLETSRCAMRGS